MNYSPVSIVTTTLGKGRNEEGDVQNWVTIQSKQGAHSKAEMTADPSFCQADPQSSCTGMFSSQIGRKSVGALCSSILFSPLYFSLL